MTLADLKQLLWTLLLLVAGLAVPLSAQPKIYVLNDLGTLGGPYSVAQGINSSGQVAGYSYRGDGPYHAFRTASNAPINSATDDLGTLGGTLLSQGFGINNSGQVVGSAFLSGAAPEHGFRTAPNAPINPATDDLGTLGATLRTRPLSINNSGQVAGMSFVSGDPSAHAFRTGPNAPINPVTDDLGTLGGTLISGATGINDLGQVVGTSATAGDATFHAFRTAPNSRINPATDDLGGTLSSAYGINNSGQVVGLAYLNGNSPAHAFRTAPNAPINPATDDLGTLGGTCQGTGINSSSDVVGFSLLSANPIEATVSHAFVYTGGAMHDLNSLVAGGSGWELLAAFAINDTGQIAGYGTHHGLTRAFRLDPLVTATQAIDVNPGTPRPASFNIDSEGALAVAILGSATLDVTMIDPTSVKFGPNGAKNIRTAALQDVNKDGTPDLVLHFAPDDSGVKCTDQVVFLIGATFSNQLFAGVEAIRTTHTFPCPR